MLKRFSVMLLAVLIGAAGAYAQSDANAPANNSGQVRSLASGQKYKIEGTVVAKDSDSSFVVRDTTGNDTRVVLGPEASVKTNIGLSSGFPFKIRIGKCRR